MIIKLALKNIKTSFSTNRSIYVLLIVSQLVAVMISFLVYGIFTAYSASMQELDMDSYRFEVTFLDADNTYVGDFRECVDELMTDIEDEVDYVFLGLQGKESMISTYWEYHGGKMVNSKTLNKEKVDIGRYINDYDYINGSKVIYGSEAAVGEMYTINGHEYEVIGKSKNTIMDRFVIMPFTAATDDMALVAMVVAFEKLPTYTQYEHFEKVLLGRFGDGVIIKDFQVKDAESLISIRSTIAISVVVGVIAALDTILLYTYIMERRRKQMAVYAILGAKRKHRFAINESEIMLLSVLVALTGYLIFKCCFEGIIVKLLSSSVELYNNKIYMIMLTGYILCIFVITYVATWINTKKNILKMLRGARNA